MLLELFTLAQLSMGTGIYDSAPAVENHEKLATAEQIITLRGSVSSASVEIFVMNNAPGLLSRCDVQDFLRAKSLKLRRSLLHDLYVHGCIDWKFLGRLSNLAKQTGYI